MASEHVVVSVLLGANGYPYGTKAARLRSVVICRISTRSRRLKIKLKTRKQDR